MIIYTCLTLDAIDASILLVMMVAEAVMYSLRNVPISWVHVLENNAICLGAALSTFSFTAIPTSFIMPDS